jgi:ABC-type Fe3+-hydroxamate transport system substrate-binding protein
MRRFIASAATAVAATLLLAACGSSEPAESDAGSESAAAAQPVSITDDRGKTVKLDAPAQKIVGLEWGLVENLITLGVQPVGVADVKGYTNWVTAEKLDASVKDVGTRSEPSVDSIVALDPDVVVTTTDSTTALMSQLEKYVPVVALKGNDATKSLPLMKDNLNRLATLTGKEDTAKTVLADFDAMLADAKEKIAGAGAAAKPFAMADGWQEGSAVSLRVWANGSLLADVLAQLGLKNAWSGAGDPVYGLVQTDVEGLTKLGDVRFLYVANDADGGDVFTQGLAGNAIWKSLPFVRGGDVHRLADGTWMFGGPASIKQFVDQVVPLYTS